MALQAPPGQGTPGEPTSSNLLEGRVAVVSGLGPGMGRDISLSLARHGADVVMVARRDKYLTRVGAEIEALGRRALGVTADITEVADCERVASAAKEQMGSVDILVNNAFSDGNFTSVEESDLDDWRSTIEVNLFGALQLTRAALPHLKENDESHVVMINTMSVQQIEPGFGAYAASKAALASATKTLARELGRDGVRVNGIHPGYIWSPKVEWYINHRAEQAATTFDEEYARITEPSCLGYIPTSEEIAGAVVFLASPLSRAVTGQSLSVNAGSWMS